MKRLILLVVLLTALLLVSIGCSPTKYIYQQPYQGVLTGLNLNYDSGSGGGFEGCVEFDNKTVIFGRFYNDRAKPLKELKLGSSYRLLMTDPGDYLDTYNIEEIR